MFRVKKRNGVLKSTWLLIGMLLGLQIALPKLLAQVPEMPDDPEFSSSSVNCLWFGGTGSWDEPANWSDCNDGVPGAGDTAIISAGQVDISGDVTIAGLEFLGGIINGPGTATSLTVTNALHLAGGEKSLALLTLVNEGIGQWTSGGWRLRLPSGGNTVGQFRNASGASFEVTGGVSMLNSFNETLSIVNDGELIKTGGGLADFNSSSVPMVNRGTIEVQQGVLRLPGGGATAPHEGSFTVATGARIEFTGPRHSFHLDSSVMGEGEVRFPGNGTWTLEAGMTYNVDGLTRVSDATDCPCRLRINTDAFTGSLQMQSGSGKFIEGINGSLTVTDIFDWHTGAIGQHFATGNFTLNVLGGITLHSGISAIAQRGIVNHYGTAVYESGSFYIRHPNARFVNHPGASFEIQGERLMSYRLGGSDPVLGVFENRGSLIKTGSEEAIIEGIAIENSGVIDVNTGSLRFTRHSSQTDPWAGARLILNDGVVNSQAPLIFENSRIYGQGVINADVEIDNDILIGSGSGGSYLAGILEINGNLDLAETSRILTPLVSDDPVPGSGYSLLQVNNSEPVELMGSLRVMVDSDFAEIEIGDEFEVINAIGGLEGTFDAVEALTEGFEFSAVYETNRVLVRVESLPGFNAPELVSPENGSLIEDLAATLQWNSVALAVSYQVQVSDDGDTFSELFADAVTSDTFFEISDLESDKEYFWRVRSQRGSGQSEWSEIWSFTIKEPSIDPHPPLAVNDTLYVATGDVVEADLLANDLDPQDEAITITALDTDGTLGVVTIGDEGLWVRYEAPDEFNGTDSFRYTIRNESGETSEAEVTVFVQPGLSADRHTIALYKFEEENTALVRDYSGNDNNATGIGTSAAESPFGTGRYMDGASDYINMGVTRQALQGATEWTIEFTAAAVDSFTGPPAMINHSCGNGWVLMRRPGNITYGVKTTAQGSCFWQDGGFQSAPAPRMDTRWHHYVLTWKSGEALRVYQDGEILVDVPTAGIFQITQVFPNTALLGRSDSGAGSFQEGFVDEVRVSNIARTPDEVQRTFLILNRYLNLETNLLPGIVTLIAPADGAVDIPANPTLSWEGSEGAEWYDLQLTEDPDFSNLLIDASDIQQTEYQITDDLKTGTTFFWRVRAGNGSGNSEWSEPQSFTTVLPASMYAEEHPKEFELSQNYPNPFNPSTRIRFALPEPSHVNLTVYSVLGQHIATLLNENLSAGWHEVSFDASVFSSAMLLYRIEAGEHIQVKQMMLIK